MLPSMMGCEAYEGSGAGATPPCPPSLRKEA